MNARSLLLAVVASVLSASFAGAADMAVKAPPPPVLAGPSMTLFAGASVSPHSWYADAGGIWAFNGNLNRDGWLLRVTGGTGNYSYLMTPTLKNSVNFQSADVMVGYQTTSGNVRFTGYLGTQVHDHHNNFDPLATINGTKWGVIGQGEIFATFADRSFLLLMGQASSVWSSYYVLGRYGYRFASNVAIGPEVTALGNKKFDAQRAGLFAAFDLTPSVQFIVSGGYHWQNETLRNGDGGYGLVHLRASF